MLNEKKPATGKVAGFLKIEKLPGKFDTQEDSRNAHHLQAARIRRQFGLSWPLARVTAELHSGRAGT